jgi:hypothetical protein
MQVTATPALLALGATVLALSQACASRGVVTAAPPPMLAPMTVGTSALLALCATAAPPPRLVGTGGVLFCGGAAGTAVVKLSLYATASAGLTAEVDAGLGLRGQRSELAGEGVRPLEREAAWGRVLHGMIEKRVSFPSTGGRGLTLQQVFGRTSGSSAEARGV